MMVILKIYLVSVVISLITDGIFNAVLMKYRVNFNTWLELVSTLRSSFCPIKNMFNVMNSVMFLLTSSEEQKKEFGTILDIASNGFEINFEGDDNDEMPFM